MLWENAGTHKKKDRSGQGLKSSVEQVWFHGEERCTAPQFHTQGARAKASVTHPSHNKMQQTEVPIEIFHTCTWWGPTKEHTHKSRQKNTNKQKPHPNRLWFCSGLLKYLQGTWYPEVMLQLDAIGASGNPPSCLEIPTVFVAQKFIRLFRNGLVAATSSMQNRHTTDKESVGMESFSEASYLESMANLQHDVLKFAAGIDVFAGKYYKGST